MSCSFGAAATMTCDFSSDPPHPPHFLPPHVELDSLPFWVRLPNSKSLKRSSSVVSLLTPPHTVRQHLHSHGLAYHSSDDEVDEVLPVVSSNASPSQSWPMSDELGAVSHKQHRVSAIITELNAKENKDTHWLAGVPVELEDSKWAPKLLCVPHSISKGKPPSSLHWGLLTSARRLLQLHAIPASSVPVTCSHNGKLNKLWNRTSKDSKDLSYDFVWWGILVLAKPLIVTMDGFKSPFQQATKACQIPSQLSIPTCPTPICPSLILSCPSPLLPFQALRLHLDRPLSSPQAITTTAHTMHCQSDLAQ